MENQTEIGIFIAISCLVVLCLVMGVFTFLNLHRKKMLEKEARIQAIELEKQIEIFKAAAQAEERQKEKIAKNLHDGIVSVLSAVNRSIDKNIKDYNNDNKLFNIDRLKKDALNIEQVIENLRGVSHDLLPPNLSSFGLIKALGYHLDTIKELDTSISDFENKTDFDETLPFNKTDQLSIFRICLEIINNLLKHSNYSYLKVTIENDEGNLHISFMHDGKGITNNEIKLISNSSNGLGLNSILSRTLLLNAQLDYLVEKETACINLKIPYKIV